MYTQKLVNFKNRKQYEGLPEYQLIDVIMLQKSNIRFIHEILTSSKYGTAPERYKKVVEMLEKENVSEESYLSTL